MSVRSLTSGALAAALLAGAAVALPSVAMPAVASAAEPATAADIVINEVESNGDPVGDWVELANLNSEQELDISGWTLVDDDPTHAPLVFPAGTTIESGGYWSIYTDETDAGFGLGGNDAVTLRDAGGELVDQFTWSGHAPTTYGRIPDMTGEFTVTGEPTRSARNVAAEEPEPVETSPWPHDTLTIEPVDLGGDFALDDMSGVDIAADGTAYVVNNGTGTLYVLDFDPATGDYSIAQTLVLKYADGAGLPDAEGVTVGPDGAVYVATERNNTASSTSRPSVLRFELPASGDATINATHEWNLSEYTGALSANGGLEAVEYIPDAWGGVFAVGVEQTGDVHFVSLATDGTSTLRQTVATELDGVMALDHEADAGVLRVLCDEVCDGRSIEMTFDGTEFVTDGTLYARPAGMANLANEGYASTVDVVACEAGGTAARARYLWADDAGLDGIGLRGALAAPGECTTGDDNDDDNPASGWLDLGSLTGQDGLFGSLGDLSADLNITAESIAELAPLPAL